MEIETILNNSRGISINELINKNIYISPLDYQRGKRSVNHFQK